MNLGRHIQGNAEGHGFRSIFFAKIYNYHRQNSHRRGHYKHCESKIIAMGDATGNALQKYRIVNYSMPDAFDDAALVRSVFNRSSDY